MGVRTIIESGASLDGVVCMGADRYETNEEKRLNTQKAIPNIGIGGGSVLRRAIIDKNARIGPNCRIGIDDLQRLDGEYATHYVVDGVIGHSQKHHRSGGNGDLKDYPVISFMASARSGSAER